MATGVLLSDDLLFSSRITGTAGALGLTIKVALNPTILVQMASELGATGALLDLGHPGLDLPKLLAALREECPKMPGVVAYGSHVDAAGLKAARDAGCDLVLPRSAFVEKLPVDLPVWLKNLQEDS